MSFQFVENAKIDGQARRLIRSHVMKGKNVGKVIPRRTRKIDPEVSPCLANHAADLRTPTIRKSDAVGITSIPRTLGNSFSYFTFSCKLETYMRNLIYQIQFVTNQTVYPVEFCLPVNGLHHIWFQWVVNDEAFFHSALAVSEAAVDAHLGKKDASVRTLYHLSNAYRCISQNLQKGGTPSDPTLAAVVSMAIHEDLKGQPARGKVHMDALQQMVELRGGVAQLRITTVLLHKMCRADIEYALHDGCFPRFNRDQFPSKMIQSLLSLSFTQQEISRVADDAHIYDPSLRRVFIDLMSVCILLNNSRGSFKLEPFMFQEIVISVCYRLLHQYPLASDGPQNNDENACQLGQLALITTMIFQNGRSPRISYSLLANRLRGAIMSMLSNEAVVETNFLWLLFVSGISVFNITSTAWLLPYIKKCSSDLNIKSWQAARDQIRKYPWIDAIHDELGQELWQASTWQLHQ